MFVLVVQSSRKITNSADKLLITIHKIWLGTKCDSKCNENAKEFFDIWNCLEVIQQGVLRDCLRQHIHEPCHLQEEQCIMGFPASES